MGGNTFKSSQLALITARGVVTGGVYGVYVSSQNQSKKTFYQFYGMKNDVKTVIEREYYSLIPPKKLLYLPKTNFWLRLYQRCRCDGNLHGLSRD